MQNGRRIDSELPRSSNGTKTNISISVSIRQSRKNMKTVKLQIGCLIKSHFLTKFLGFFRQESIFSAVAGGRRTACRFFTHQDHQPEAHPAPLFHFSGHSRPIPPPGVHAARHTGAERGEGCIANQHSVQFSLRSATPAHCTVRLCRTVSHHEAGKHAKAKV